MCDRNRAQVGVIHCAGCKALSKIAGEAGGCHFNVWPNKHGLEVGARASKPRWPARVRAACNKHVRVAEVEKERLRVKVVLCLLHPELSRIDELRTNPLGAATDLDGLGVDDHLDRGAGPTGLQRFQEGVLGVEERSCDHHAPGRRRDRVAELFEQWRTAAGLSEQSDVGKLRLGAIGSRNKLTDPVHGLQHGGRQRPLLGSKPFADQAPDVAQNQLVSRGAVRAHVDVRGDFPVETEAGKREVVAANEQDTALLAGK